MTTLSMSGNDSAEEKIIKIEKVDQLPEKIVTPAAEASVEKNPEKSLEKIETNKPSGKVADETQETYMCETHINDENSIKEKTSEIEKSKITPGLTKKVIRNQSDIFSLKDISTTLQTSIFSVNGSPSRRIFCKQQPVDHVFQNNEVPPSEKTSPPRGSRITKENYNDEKRPSSSYRNPLTGTGLTSSDEYQPKGNRRKDGNPLLGLGYDNVTESPK